MDLRGRLRTNWSFIGGMTHVKFYRVRIGGFRSRTLKLSFFCFFI
jgi:hypothetical protein